jgi:hypothetical protein
MKHLKLFENNPAFYDDPPEPRLAGADVEYKEEEQLFTPVYCHEEHPEQDKSRHEKGHLDFAVLMDKTPQKTIWVVRDIDEAIPQRYLSYWETYKGGEYTQDTDSVLNFATDEFKANRWVDGFDAWEENDWAVDLVKITTVEDIDSIIHDLSNFVSPSHASHYGKARNPNLKGFYKTRSVPDQGEISMAKRAIRTLEMHKRKIQTNTVGGSTPA